MDIMIHMFNMFKESKVNIQEKHDKNWKTTIYNNRPKSI